MTPSEINRHFDLLSLASRDTRLSGTGAYHVGPCPFCGGRDRFSVKSTPGGYRWYCRKCGDGKYHTAIDYVMRREHLDFGRALRSLAGEIRPPGDCQVAPAGRPSRTLRAGLATTSRTNQISLVPDASWQSAAWREVDAAAEALLQGDAGQAGRAYLTSRGLERGTWLAWQLGFAHVYDPPARRKRGAIVLPWFDADPHSQADVITAIKYRFIDHDRRGLSFARRDRRQDLRRYISRRGSMPILYGLWSAKTDDDTLLLVEGEINALSVWQCMPQGVTCLSFGSEGGAKPELLAALALRYERTILWVDDPERGSAIREALGGHVVALRSPVRDEVKLDANAILGRGLPLQGRRRLEEFLSEVLRSHAKSVADSRMGRGRCRLAGD